MPVHHSTTCYIPYSSAWGEGGEIINLYLGTCLNTENLPISLLLSNKTQAALGISSTFLLIRRRGEEIWSSQRLIQPIRVFLIHTSSLSTPDTSCCAQCNYQLPENCSPPFPKFTSWTAFQWFRALPTGPDTLRTCLDFHYFQQEPQNRTENRIALLCIIDWKEEKKKMGCHLFLSTRRKEQRNTGTGFVTWGAKDSIVPGLVQQPANTWSSPQPEHKIKTNVFPSFPDFSWVPHPSFISPSPKVPNTWQINTADYIARWQKKTADRLQDFSSQICSGCPYQ